MNKNKTNWSPVAAIESMREEKDGDHLISVMFNEIARQLKSKERLVGAAAGACIFDEDIVVMKVAGHNALYLVASVNRDEEEFAFQKIDTNIDRYIAEIQPLLNNIDGVKEGTIQLYKGY